MPLHGPVPIVVLPRSRTAITLHPRSTPYPCASIQPFRSPHKVRLNSNLSTDRLRLPMRHLSLFPSRTPPAHISTQSHPFSFPSSTNHLHRLQARPSGYSASTAHTCTPLFGGTTVERPGTPRNVIFQSLLPLPHYSFFFFAAGSSSLSDDDTSSVPGRPLISYRVAPLIGCAHPIRIKRHPISRPYRVASLIVCAHVGRWAASEGW